MRSYYFINNDVNPDSVYGSEMPRCIPATEIIRLAKEWENDDLFTDFHLASATEIAEHGTWDDGLTDTWYAVLLDREDNDWGHGSHFIAEAKYMARRYRDDRGYADAYIAVIDEATNSAIEEISDIDEE